MLPNEVVHGVGDGNEREWISPIPGIIVIFENLGPDYWACLFSVDGIVPLACASFAGIIVIS